MISALHSFSVVFSNGAGEGNIAARAEKRSDTFLRSVTSRAVLFAAKYICLLYIPNLSIGIRICRILEFSEFHKRGRICRILEFSEFHNRGRICSIIEFSEFHKRGEICSIIEFSEFREFSHFENSDADKNNFTASFRTSSPFPSF